MLGLFNKASAGKGRIGLAFGANQIALAVTRRDSAGPVLERCELLHLNPASGADAGAAPAATFLCAGADFPWDLSFPWSLSRAVATGAAFSAAAVLAGFAACAAGRFLLAEAGFCLAFMSTEGVWR